MRANQLWQKIRPFLLVTDAAVTPPPFTLPEPPPHQQRQNQAAGPLTRDLAANVARIKAAFSTGISRGLVVRQLQLGAKGVAAALLYVPDQVDWEHLNRVLLTPLLNSPLPATLLHDPQALVERVLPEGRAYVAATCDAVTAGILTGSAALLVAGSDQAALVEVQGWAKRAVERPVSEMTVRGPQEAFTEDIRTNLSLVRRRLRTGDLMVERMQIGRISKTDVILLYLKSIANPGLVAEVRRRLEAIDVDYLADSGTVEQLIEDRAYSLFPSLISTERPDRVASQVAEGYAAILVGNTPFSLIVPGTMMMYLQSPEDSYLRWPYGTFLRGVRFIAFLSAVLFPGVYVAIANFHQEMIPTALMMAISGARETVPLPTVLEVWLMESMFELIREAGIRIPTMIGPTIGIVGALILGQAAVQAGIISPIMVIITAATGLASFTIPNYNMQFATRLMRFVYIIAAATYGLVGISVLAIVSLTYLGAGQSFGVPWFSPLTPPGRQGDSILRQPTFKQEKRPPHIKPQKSREQGKTQRPWDNSGMDAGGKGDEGE